EGTGPQSLTVSWQGPTGPKLPIAPDVLFRETPTPTTNQPPTLTLPISALTSHVGDAVSIQASASDPDGDPLYFSGTLLPAGISIDPNTGLISGTLAPTSVGVHNATIGVSDGPAAASRKIWWWVEDRPAPVLALAAPANGALLTGITNLTAAASDDVGVVGVQFLVDGTAFGAEDTAAPYLLAWNTAPRTCSPGTPRRSPTGRTPSPLTPATRRET